MALTRARAAIPEGATGLRVTGDLEQTSDYSFLEGIEVLVHLAAHVHVMGKQGPGAHELFHRVNCESTVRLARAARQRGTRRLVFMSTVKVYGDRPRDHILDEQSPRLPSDGYGESKRRAEELLLELGEATGLEVVVLQPPLVYGPYVRANFLSLMTAIQRGLPLPFGAVQNRRSMIYVENLGSAIVFASSHAQARGTYLVSDGEDVSTRELAHRIASALGVHERLVPVPVPILQLVGRVTGKTAAVERVVGSLYVSSKRLREAGWSSPFSMQQGLADTARWFVSRC